MGSPASQPSRTKALDIAHPSKRLERRLRSYARLSGVVAIVVGVVALGGWWLGVRVVTVVASGWPPMVANTALMSMLAGLALLLLTPPRPDRSNRIAATICSGVVCLIAGLTLAEYLSGIDFGIDRLLIQTSEAPVARLPGRPAPHSAAAFFALAVALLLLDSGTTRRFRAAEFLALAGAAIPVVALLGYLFGVEGLYGIPALLPHSGMAIQTAAVVLFLASGTLAARPDSGLMSVITADDMGGVVARRLLWSLVVLPPVAVLLVLGTRTGRYSTASAVAFLLFFALVEGIAVVVLTSSRLSRLDAELRRSESHVRALFERASDGIFIADLGGRYTSVNQAGHRMLGYSDDELVGQRIVDIIPPEDARRLEEARDQLRGGRSLLAEWRLRCKDGTYLPVEVNAAILPDGRWQAIVRDITERKAAEEALVQAREAERRARLDLERVTSASIAISDALANLPETGLELALRTVVLQAQTLTGAHFAALGIGTDPDRPFDPWIFMGIGAEEAAAIGRHPRPIGTLGIPAREGRVIRTRDLHGDASFRGMPDKHPMMKSLLGVPIFYRGKPVGNIYLTEKQGAHEFTADDERNVRMLATRTGAAIEAARLYEREALQRTWLQTLFDSMPECVVITDEKGKVVQQNQASRLLAADTGVVGVWGNPILHDVRTPSGDLLSPDELPIYRALIHGETVVGKELALISPDGRLVPIIASATPVKTEHGPRGAIAVFQDISAMKELERLREEWAAVIAHDLRQPVTVISMTASALERLRREELPEEDRKALERIRSASSRLTRMINDLLEASRIEAKRLPLERRDVDVGSLIDRVVESFQAANVGRRMEVLVESHLEAWADPGRVEQVLENLLLNAAKYGTPGTPIVIQAKAQEAFVEVMVSNRGPGVSAEQLPLLFNRFSRTREARTGREPGLGLGLYISKGLVEAHGGRIWAESAPGETTAFHFTLPIAIADHDVSSESIGFEAHREFATEHH